MFIDRIFDGEYGFDFILYIFLVDDFRKIFKLLFEVFGLFMFWIVDDLFFCELEF